MTKIQAQLVSFNKGREQASLITFSCSKADINTLNEFIDEVRIKFFIDGAESDVIVGNLTSINITASGDSKFKIKCPGTENVKTSQLSTLCGNLLNLNIELDV